MPDESIGSLRRLVREQRLRVIPVVTDERQLRLAGLVKRSSLLEVSSTRTEARAKDLMSPPRIALSPSYSVRSALKEMLRLDEWYAPVVDNGLRYLGVFGLEDAIRYIVGNYEKELLVPLAEVMQRDIVYVEPDTPVPRVWQLMRRHGFAALPVVKNGVIVGVVAEHDLIIHGYTRPDFEADSYRKGPLVQEVMSTPPITLHEESTLLDAARLILKRDIGRVYVVDDNKRLVGVIDRSDVVSYWLKH